VTGLAAREVAITRQVAGLALLYPDDALRRDLPVLRTAVGGLPAAVAGPLAGLLDHLARTPPDVLAADYVATFDLSRRHALHLTYFTHGDTRKRGLALLRIKQTYRRFGFVLDDTELPDHLSVVLEFAATVDAAAGTRCWGWHSPRRARRTRRRSRRCRPRCPRCTARSARRWPGWRPKAHRVRRSD
jgi:nitrate reductase molybdenum cofactor assembly chaperone NarJ/NarW